MITAGARAELRRFGVFVAAFAVCFFLPVDEGRFQAAVGESLHLVHDYAREHVILCLLPALWIAGAVGVFVSSDSVLAYLGPTARPAVAYGVASISGAILAVCSCTVLPLFSGIYRIGAGLGPATTFLYSGPAINVLAIVLTARVLGVELGLARGLAAVALSLVIGVTMAWIFRRERSASAAVPAAVVAPARSLSRTLVFFGAMVAFLVFANWSSGGTSSGFFAAVHAAKWKLAAAAGLVLAVVSWRWIGLRGTPVAVVVALVAATAVGVPAHPEAAVLVGVLGLAYCTAGRGGEAGEWFDQSWGFAKQILPLLAGGVLLAGFLFGRPGHEALVPNAWIAGAVGGNSLAANLFAAVGGALMYFATLTEIPILQGLQGSGMGSGPALALLLSGPAVSLPSLLVLSSVFGWRKTLAFSLLVVLSAAAIGFGFGLVAAPPP